MVPKLQIYTQVEPLQLGSLKFDEFDWKLLAKLQNTPQLIYMCREALKIEA